MSQKSINIKLAATGKPVEIERGDGYIYFIYDDGGAQYVTHSVMVPYLNLYSEWEWVVMGTEFAEAVEDDRYDAGNGRIKPKDVA